MSIIISIFPWKHSWLMLLIISLFIRTLAAVPLVSGGRVLFCFLDWKWPPLLVQQQVNQFSRWAPDLFSKSPFVYFWLRAFCPRLLICVKKKVQIAVHLLFSVAWRDPGCHDHAGAAPSPPKATFFYSHVLPEQTALLSRPVPPLTGHCPGNMHCCSMQIRSHWDRGSGRGHPELSGRGRERRPGPINESLP